MGYIDYRPHFSETRHQYNIMAVVGNGFDIQCLKDLGVEADTRYPSFFEYLESRDFNGRNLIFAEMSRLKAGGFKNWSDVEDAIDGLRRAGTQIVLIAIALEEIQGEFAKFLDDVVTPDVLARLGHQAVDNRLTIASLMEFPGDVQTKSEYDLMHLPPRLNIGDLFNFTFVNLNYTSLLDDFVYLDKTQFKPHPYKWSDRQVTFHPNPQGHPDVRERQSFVMESYLTTAVIHPHGTQSTPRSLLFGINAGPEDVDGRDLSKPYWAQNDLRYGDLFGETDLFILFGCSLGATDSWWWSSIITALEREENAPDAMIYWFNPRGDETEETVRAKLAVVAGRADEIAFRETLRNRVRVILYNATTPRAWLNTNPDIIPDWIHPLTRNGR